MKNLIIIYGAKNTEHDISIITACLAKGYFANYNLFCVYLDKNNIAYLAPNGFTPAMHVRGKLTKRVVFLTGERSVAVIKRNRIVRRVPVDAVVNCCHGSCGEDGTVASLCGLLNVPIVGSALTPSAIAMDKILTKQILSGLGMPVVDGFEVNLANLNRLDELAKGYSFPLIVKPNTLGSSIGVAVCRNADELKRNLNTALKYDHRVLVEKALTDFCELNCASFRADNAVQVSRVDVPTTARDILTFEDKYLDASSAQPPKTDVCDEVTAEVRTLTERIYVQLGFSGVIRADYLYDNLGKKLYVNEINSIPGSLAYGLFSDKYGLTEYGDALLKQAERDFAEREKLVTSFTSSVLTLGAGAKRRKK